MVHGEVAVRQAGEVVVHRPEGQILLCQFLGGDVVDLEQAPIWTARLQG